MRFKALKTRDVAVRAKRAVATCLSQEPGNQLHLGNRKYWQIMVQFRVMGRVDSTCPQGISVCREVAANGSSLNPTDVFNRPATVHKTFLDISLATLSQNAGEAAVFTEPVMLLGNEEP